MTKLLGALVAAVGALGLIGLGSYLYMEWSRPVLTNALRPSGTYAQLAEGMMAYRFHEPAFSSRLPTLVMVHGFSTPSPVWNGLLPALTERGYPVLTYDHFGRGFSDRPRATYDESFYQRTLEGLLTKLEIQGPIVLVGYSMGGPIAARYAADHPGRVAGLVLLAPAGYEANSGSSGLVRFIRTPLIGQWFWEYSYGDTLLEEIQAEVDSEDPLALSRATMMDIYRQQLRYRGMLPALWSTLRNFPLFDQAATYRELATARVPTLAIWGTADRVVPFRGSEGLLGDVPDIRLVSLQGARHSLTYRLPGQVVRAMLEFLPSLGQPGS